jgi:hypothetical protein
MDIGNRFVSREREEEQARERSTMVYSLFPHHRSWSWKAHPMFDCPIEALVMARTIAGETGEPVDVGCDARNFIRVSKDGAAGQMYGWSHFYTGDPTRTYTDLLMALVALPEP